MSNKLFHCDEKLEKFLNKLGYTQAKDNCLFEKKYDLGIYFIFKFDWHFNELKSPAVFVEEFEYNSEYDLDYLKDVLNDFNNEKIKLLKFMEELHANA